MPLVKSNLVRDFSKFMVPDSEGFEGSPENAEEFADKFSKAINDYAASIVPPTNPATLPAATSALKTALMAVGPPFEAAQQFSFVITPAMLAFATVVGVGMGTVSGGAIVAVPPTAALGVSIAAKLATLQLANSPAPECVEELAGTIDGWFKTGTANGTPWS